MVTFRGDRARWSLPPTGSVELAQPGWPTSPPAAARRWPRASLSRPTWCCANALRDPQRRAAGRAGDRRPRDRRRRTPVPRAVAAAGHVARQGIASRGGGLRERPRFGSGWPVTLARCPGCGVPATSEEIAADALSGVGPGEGRGLMPQGTARVRCREDGLTTRQRRNRPLTDRAHRRDEGEVDGRVRDGPAGVEPGLDVGVFQFVKSAKWKVGEENALRALGESTASGASGPVQWHKMGEGWSWARKRGHGAGPRRGGPGGLAADPAASSPPRRTTSTCWTSSPTR